MNKKMRLISHCVAVAGIGAILSAQLPTLAQQSSAPAPAPSFLRQAGQSLFDNAQKRVLHSIDERVNPQTGMPIDATTGAPGSVPPITVTTGPKEAPPCRCWSLPEKPLACLLSIHGLGLQSNSYEYFGQETSKRGIAVYAIDVRGFGSWMNAKGKTKVNFDDCLDDIKLSLQSIHNANPGLPVYLLGESMGGAIALRAAAMYPDLVDGLISSVPASERFNQGKTSMKVFLNLLTGMNLANVGGDVVNQATQNSKLKAAWEGDPLARLNLSPQELIQFQDFMNHNHEFAPKVTSMPVLFVQGNGDHLVKPEGTWELFNDVASTDKSFLAVPGEHLIFEEAQTQDPAVRDQNFRIISAWLATKVGYRHRGNWRGGVAGSDPSTGGRWNAGTTSGAGVGAAISNNGSTWGGAGSAGTAGGWNGMGGPSSNAGAWTSGSPNGTRGAFGGRPGINLQGLETQAQLIDSGQYANAITQLEQIRSQRPNDPNVIALLGKAYFRNGQTDQATQLFRAAMRARRGGGDQAQALNSYMLNMSGSPTPVSVASNVGQPTPTPETSSSPFASFIRRIGGSLASGQFGGGTNNGANLGNGPSGGAFTGTGTNGGASADSRLVNSATPASKAKVYAFFANWADQCKDLPSTMNKLASTYGNLADITQVNIEDAASDNLVDRYKIGPIPTVVFVAPNGQVTSTIIGASQYDNYDQAMKSATRGTY